MLGRLAYRSAPRLEGKRYLNCRSSKGAFAILPWSSPVAPATGLAHRLRGLPGSSGTAVGLLGVIPFLSLTTNLPPAPTRKVGICCAVSPQIRARPNSRPLPRLMSLPCFRVPGEEQITSHHFV
jgi:hypothetical protein